MERVIALSRGADDTIRVDAAKRSPPLPAHRARVRFRRPGHQAEEKQETGPAASHASAGRLEDPPGAAVGETNRLVFRVSPLTSKGLLSVQVHEALKTLLQDNHGAAIVKLRAFVAGSGDLRRVQTLVSEVFSERKLNIPALSTIQVGALPMEGAQVVIESIAEEKKTDKKTGNPNGLAFFSGQQTKDVNQSIAQLRTAMDSVGVSRESVLRATCFLSSLDDFSGDRIAIHAAFPSAALDLVQQQRLGLDQLVECEAVGRLEKSPASSPENRLVTLVNPPALAQNPNYSHIALVNSAKIVFSGTQMAFGDQDKDVRLAFDRLRKALEAQGVSYKDVFWSATYPLTKTMADKVSRDPLRLLRPVASAGEYVIALRRAPFARCNRGSGSRRGSKVNSNSTIP